MNLTHKDYIKILKHYKLKIPKSKNKIKSKALDVLAGKLCRCIKKVKKKKIKKTQKKYRKNAATAICISSILKKRGLKHNRFTCKKKSKFLKNKKTKKYLSKSKKKFNMKYI
jgi:hypothetical protein